MVVGYAEIGYDEDYHNSNLNSRDTVAMADLSDGISGFRDYIHYDTHY
jgi:hypothetical protein